MLKQPVFVIFSQILAFTCMGVQDFAVLQVEAHAGPYSLSRPCYLDVKVYWERKNAGTLYLHYYSNYRVQKEPTEITSGIIEFDSDGYFYYHYQIPYSILSKNAALQLQVTTFETNGFYTVPHNSVILFSDLSATVQKDDLITSNTSIDLGRNCHRFELDDQVVKQGHEKISFWNVDNKTTGGRSLELSTLYFEYECYGYADEITFLEDYEAYIRIKSHPEDFTIGNYVDGAREIRAKVTYYDSFESLFLPYHGSGFKIEPASTLYVSTKDFKMSTNPAKLSSPVQTKDIFAPLHTGHDNDLYSYDIVLYDLTLGHDTFTITKSITPTSHKFGNCLEATYCVVLGEN